MKDARSHPSELAVGTSTFMQVNPTTARSQGLTRLRAFALAALTVSCAQAELRGQAADLTRPPPLVESAGDFVAIRVSRPPLIDGREWIPANVQTTSEPGTVAVPTSAFSLTLTDCGDHDGDFERCHVLFRRGRDTPVQIDAGYTGFLFVTPNGRYIVTEPLYVLDVREWKQYALFEALHIPNYTSIEAISRDGMRLFISRRDCPIDCRRDVNVVEYYELTLPR